MTQTDIDETTTTNPLHLYMIDDTDVFVAESPEEALALMKADFGTDVEGADVRLISDDKEFPVHIEKDGPIAKGESPYEKVIKTAGAWAKENGKGYVFSTEY
jgi:hypothetical protein